MSIFVDNRGSSVRVGFPLFRPPSRTKVRYGLVAEIGDEDSDIDDAIKGAKIEIMRWVYRSVSLPAPRYFDLTTSFENNDTPGVKYGLATDGASWIAKMEKADREINGRYWTTEINVTRSGDSAWLAVRNMCTGEPGIAENAPISTPRFIGFFTRSIGLLDAEVAIGYEPWAIEDEQDLDDLAELLVREDRFLPIILITEPYALNATLFAKRGVGVAHVVTMPDQFTRRWSERVGKEFGAFFGAVRTYNAGLDLAADSPFDHPLALRARVLEFQGPERRSGPDGFAEYLLHKAYAAGASRVVRDQRFPRFSALRAATLIHERQSSTGTLEGQDLLDLAQEEIRQAKQMETIALEENARLDKDLRQTRAEMLGMQARIDHLVGVIKSSGRHEVVEIPETLEDLRDWAEKYLGGRVHILPRAYRGAKDSLYTEPRDIYQALLWLATDYYAAKNVEDARDSRRVDMRLRLEELGMEYGGSVQEEFADDFYFVQFGSSKRFMNMAVKKGRDRDPRNCMRIYTFWDEEAQQTIVGSLPQHGPIRES